MQTQVYEYNLNGPNYTSASTVPAGSAWEQIEAQNGGPGFSASEMSKVQRTGSPMQDTRVVVASPIMPLSSGVTGAGGEFQELQLVHAMSRLKKDSIYFAKMGKIGDKLDKRSRRFIDYRARINNKLADVRFENQEQALFLADFLNVDRQLRENVEKWNRALRQMVVFPSKTALKESFDSVISSKKRFLAEQRGTSSAFRTLDRASLSRLNDRVPETAAAIQRYREARSEFALKHRELEAEKYRLFDENVRRLTALQLANMRESLAAIRQIQTRMHPELYQAQAQQLQMLREIQPRTTAETLLKQKRASSPALVEQVVTSGNLGTTYSNSTTTLPAAYSGATYEVQQQVPTQYTSSSPTKEQVFEKIPNDSWTPIRGGMISQLPATAY